MANPPSHRPWLSPHGRQRSGAVRARGLCWGGRWGIPRRAGNLGSSPQEPHGHPPAALLGRGPANASPKPERIARRRQGCPGVRALPSGTHPPAEPNAPEHPESSCHHPQRLSPAPGSAPAALPAPACNRTPGLRGQAWPGPPAHRSPRNGAGGGVEPPEGAGGARPRGTRGCCVPTAFPERSVPGVARTGTHGAALPLQGGTEGALSPMFPPGPAPPATRACEQQNRGTRTPKPATAPLFLRGLNPNEGFMSW